MWGFVALRAGGGACMGAVDGGMCGRSEVVCVVWPFGPFGRSRLLLRRPRACDPEEKWALPDGCSHPLNIVAPLSGTDSGWNFHDPYSMTGLGAIDAVFEEILCGNRNTHVLEQLLKNS